MRRICGFSTATLVAIVYLFAVGEAVGSGEFPAISISPDSLARRSNSAGAERLIPRDSFAMLDSGPNELQFSFDGDPVGSVRLDDGTLVFYDRRHANVPVGPRGSLPLASTWIAAPPGSHPVLTVRIESSTAIPWPDGTSEEERRELLGLLQSEGWSTAPECWVRRQWGMPFRLCPVIPDGNGGLRYILRASVHVQFAHPGGPSGRSVTDPSESFYREQFLNYRQAQGWRRPPGDGGPPARKTRGDYFTSTPNPWIKIFVPRRAYYEIRGEDLRVLGLSLEAIDPATLRLFCAPHKPLSESASVWDSPSWMREVPIEVAVQQPGFFGATDVVRFLGQGPDGWFDDLGVPATPWERYYIDPYNNEDVYWLTWGGQFTENPQPLRLPVEDRTPIPNSTPYKQVFDRAHFESDLIWDPRPRDIYLVPAAQAQWESFFWADLGVNLRNVPRAVRLTPPDPFSVSDHTVRLRLRFWGNSYNRLARPWPDHTVNISMNGHEVATRSWSGFGHLDVDTTGLWLSPGSQDLELLLPYHPNPPYADSTRFDHAYLSWVEMDYWRTLRAAGDSLSFFAGGYSGAQTLELNGFSRNDVFVLDTTAPFSPIRLQPEITAGDSAGYRARFRVSLDPEHPSRFLACTGAALGRPRMALYQIPEGGYLRNRTAAVQGLIVTHSDFVLAAQQLALFRRDHFPGLPTAAVEVVDIQDIQDEFSFGRVDPTGLRNFFQMADSTWTGGNRVLGPSYVVLLGDAHYDFRNRLGLGARSFVPTFEGYYDPYFQSTIYSPQFASDDFYGYLGGPGDYGLDLFIGRLPAQTAADAKAMVDKIISYEESPNLDDWRGRITLIADDVCQGTHPDALKATHMLQTEELVPLIPKNLQQDKIYLYEYGAECIYDRKPAAAADLQTRIREGTLLVNFTGHGSEGQLADERVLETSDVAGMTNQDRPFLFFTASCSVGKYDFFGEGLGESLILHPAGGAIAIFSASAIAYSTGNAALNRRFFVALFPDSTGGPARAIGEAAVLAKAALGGDINSHRYILLGDPATRLAAPARKIDLALFDARRGVALGDSLIRGMLTDLTGRVLDDAGNQARGYNGTISVRVYDSGVLRDFIYSGQEVKYELTGAPIFRGTAEVVDGLFHVRFQVPSALATGTGGKGRVFVHVRDPFLDGQGSFSRLGVSLRTLSPPDRQGPTITLKVEGDPSAVLPRSYFWATLKDSSGINITGLVGSRSVVAQVEENGSLVSAEDISNKVVFPAGYDSASVQASLPASLKAGHTYDLILRASDNFRNSARADISITVAGTSAADFALSDVYNFPNPTEGATTFFGTLTQNSEVDLEIFTLAGRSIWRLDRPQSMTPADFARTGINWNGLDRDGDTLANGVYLYKITARSEQGGRSLSKIERLVHYSRR